MHVFPPLSSGDALWKNRIKAKMLDGWLGKCRGKLVARKYYGDLQSLPIPTHRRKSTSYDSILVIVGRLTKMIHYKPLHILIDAPRLPDSID